MLMDVYISYFQESATVSLYWYKYAYRHIVYFALFNCLGKIPRRGMLGSNGIFTLNFMRHAQIYSYACCTSLYSQHQSRSFFLLIKFPAFSSYLLTVNFNVTHLTVTGFRLQSVCLQSIILLMSIVPTLPSISDSVCLDWPKLLCCYTARIPCVLEIFTVCISACFLFIISNSLPNWSFISCIIKFNQFAFSLILSNILLVKSFIIKSS